MTIDPGDLASVLSALIAVPAAAFAFVQARDAKRSADTAREELVLSRQRFAIEHPEVAWRIERLGQSAYRLVNTGRMDATGVTLQVQTVRADRLPVRISIPAGGASPTFIISSALGRPRPAHALVSWDGHEERVPVLLPAS